MEPSSGIKTWQWVVTIIVIIILIIIGILVFGNKETPTDLEPNNTNGTSTTSAGANRITMTDQYPGNVVYLGSVQLENPAWVVIQKDNNGQPGAVIGSTRFEAGVNTGRVTLSEPMVDGATYYAVLYSVGTGTTFNPSTSQPLRDANGNIIMRVFKASSSVEGFKG